MSSLWDSIETLFYTNMSNSFAKFFLTIRFFLRSWEEIIHHWQWVSHSPGKWHGPSQPQAQVSKVKKYDSWFSPPSQCRPSFQRQPRIQPLLRLKFTATWPLQHPRRMQLSQPVVLVLHPAVPVSEQGQPLQLWLPLSNPLLIKRHSLR